MGVAFEISLQSCIQAEINGLLHSLQVIQAAILHLRLSFSLTFGCLHFSLIVPLELENVRLAVGISLQSCLQVDILGCFIYTSDSWPPSWIQAQKIKKYVVMKNTRSTTALCTVHSFLSRNWYKKLRPASRVATAGNFSLSDSPNCTDCVSVELSRSASRNSHGNESSYR